jgi:hypothetical protein
MKILAGAILTFNLVIAVTLVSIMATLAVAQTPKQQPKESWQTILEDGNMIHQLEENSIYRENKEVYHFIHKIIFKTARPAQGGKKITHILTIGAVHCGAQKSVVVADIFYDGDTELAKNLIAKNDYPAEPEEGTPHRIIMRKLCGYPKNSV